MRNYLVNRLNNSMEEFVRPISIPSPISGFPVTPRLIEKDMGDRIIVEAHWIDPQSGAFIRKGIVEIRNKKVVQESSGDESVEDILDYAAGDPDYMYKLYRYYGTKGKLSSMESRAAKYIYDRYQEITSEGLGSPHGDDDSEDIFAAIADEIIYDQLRRESWPDAGEMTPELLKRVKSDEKRDRESQGYKPAGRWFGTYRRDDEKYGVPDRKQAAEFYEDLEDEFRARTGYESRGENILQDFLAYGDMEEGEIKNYIYEYDIADPEEKEYIINLIISWAEGNA